MYAANTTHVGIMKWSLSMYPAVASTPAMIPMVFWASLAPWFRLNIAAETSCSFRNQ